MSRPPLSYLTAYLQTVVAILFVNYYFAIIVMLLLGWGKVPDNMLELAKALILSLTGALGLLMAFLYLRSRVDGPPDPATTTVTQTTESVTTPSPPTGAPNAPIPPTLRPAGPAADPGGLRDSER